MNPVSLLASVHASAATVFTLATIYALVRAKKQDPVPAAWPRVVLLRPSERITAADVDRFADDRATYGGEIVRIACVAEAPPPGALESDPFLHVAIDPSKDDPPANRKAMHLAAGVDFARARGLIDDDTIVVQADADLILRPGILEDVVAQLLARNPGGAVCVPPAPSGGSAMSAWLASAVLTASPQSFAAVHSLAETYGSPIAVAGKLVAMRAPTLEAIGGYRAISRYIGDDLALADALRDKNRPVGFASVTTRSVDEGRSVRSLSAQLVRWLRVLFAHRPMMLLAYPTMIAPVVISAGLVALAVFAGGDVRMPVEAFVALIAARTILAALLIRKWYPGESRVTIGLSPVAVVASDLVLTLALPFALLRSIQWEGRRYRVARGGRIVECAAIHDGAPARPQGDPAA